MAARRPSLPTRGAGRGGGFVRHVLRALRPGNLRLFILVFIAIGAWLGLLPRNEIRGVADAADGDTLIIAGERVRLYGIDAPELLQPCHDGTRCGQRAQAHLAGLISGRIVTCEQRDTDRYGREVAQCYLASDSEDGKAIKGEDIGRAMVRDGQAMAYGAITRTYAADEPARFDFDPPWDWRERHDAMTKEKR